MLTTEKYNCRYLAQALVHYGVRHVVVSPGSRNAPMIVAVARTEGLECHVVIDERSAAFVALGMAIETGEPVAIVCTSGSAAMNYGPALAEAYYRRVPLIAITADRPEEWIDQDDSQTIRQAHALDAVVKGSFDIPVCRGDDAGLKRLCAHRVCDALILALKKQPGPVHINLQIDEPIDGMTDDSGDYFSFPSVNNVVCAPDKAFIKRCAAELARSRVLIIAGFMSPCPSLSAILEKLPQNFAVLSEVQSNLKGPFAANIDATLSAMSDAERESARPDFVLTFGGALLSRMVKTYLRHLDIRHWSIGMGDHCIDPLLHLERIIDCETTDFFRELLAELPSDNIPDYRNTWTCASNRGFEKSMTMLNTAQWSDFKAMGMLMEKIPCGMNIHLSNGTAVRYAQLFDCSAASRVECNRGVSGIDGCTSTAIGAAMLSHSPTLLITGDMSAQYDMGALAITGIPASFRMVVLNNSGGGIFRFIQATRNLPEMERFLAADVRLPLRELCIGFGFSYFEAGNEQELSHVLSAFFASPDRPAILNIITPPQQSADTIKNFFNIKQ